MDPRERRRQTAATARIGFFCITAVAALLFVIQLLRSSEGEAAGARMVDSIRVASLGEPQQATSLLGGSAVGGELHQVQAVPPQPPALQVVQDAALSSRIRSHIQAALAEASKLSQGKVTAANTTIAVHVVRPAKAQELVSRKSDTSLLPASNMKLVTSAAALVLLHPDWHFETRFESRAQLVGGVLQGDLIVRAGGDPLYDAHAHGEVSQLFEPVVRALRAVGLERIEGDLVLDEGSYLEPAPGPGWPAKSQYWQEHCARSGGFSANGGCLTANVSASQPGATAPSDVRPLAHGLKRIGSVKTVKAGARLDVAVGATPGRVTLRGKFPAGQAAWSDRFAAPDPVELFGHVLRAALRDGGITLGGRVVRQRGAPAGRELAVLRTPLADALYPINLDSNNAIADQLFFALGDALGEGGTRAGGERATKRALAQLGVLSEGLVQVDGSGLSRDSRLTARQLTALLAATTQLEPESFELFYDTLPVSGESGSLARRMKDATVRGRIHAKTGWIEGASALSGFVTTEGGERLVFSILVKYPRASGLNTHCWKPMQDAICADLVKWHE